MTETGGGPADPVLAELWRGGVLESVHRGAAAVAAPGGLVESWGEVRRPVLPRSALKPLQALALVESGAADARRLGSEELALACASHSGTPAHTERVAGWLAALGLAPGDLGCGAHPPLDGRARAALRLAGVEPSPVHHQCSGKHCGFLTLAVHLGAEPRRYLEPDGPVQARVRAAIEEVADETVTATVIDGCSAPAHALSLAALARAMARLARPETLAGRRAEAARRLVAAMKAHPELIGGPGRDATRFTRDAAAGAVAKTGAEGCFVAALPAAGIGIALKIADGAERAAAVAMAGLLARAGALAPDEADRPVLTTRGAEAGRLRAAPALLG